MQIKHEFTTIVAVLPGIHQLVTFIQDLLDRCFARSSLVLIPMVCEAFNIKDSVYQISNYNFLGFIDYSFDVLG
jgi:hypothetical protein